MRFKMLFLAGSIALLVAVVVAGLALAGSTRSETTAASVATARFHNLAAAQAAGYTAVVQDLAGNTCIAQAGAGGMGTI
jgi:hypothetical protein